MAAVINPDVTPEELRRVSYGLASMHSNSRTMLNASALPAMGKAGALGSCALSSDAEYDPAVGLWLRTRSETVTHLPQCNPQPGVSVSMACGPTLDGLSCPRALTRLVVTRALKCSSGIPVR